MSNETSIALAALEADTFAPSIAAYLGDAVYELAVRRWTIKTLAAQRALTPKAIHFATIARVQAAYQANLLTAIEPQLTDSEKDWVRRAKNVSTKTARKQDQAVHRHATALEALVGWWSVHAPERMAMLTPYWSQAVLTSVIETHD
ncbi:MAG: ribonuclease III domain-containing protein [Vampirovibrionales bacterium]|nr:ribonuclease III domain-containing protein [Vampirovibrionales bacterium]